MCARGIDFESVSTIFFIRFWNFSECAIFFAAADDRISCEHRSNVNVNSTNCLIFTSGTTGTV
jgi:long-subunit acyl-CoA synthetase (AMP-forming)